MDKNFYTDNYYKTETVPFFKWFEEVTPEDSFIGTINYGCKCYDLYRNYSNGVTTYSAVWQDTLGNLIKTSKTNLELKGDKNAPYPLRAAKMLTELELLG